MSNKTQRHNLDWIYLATDLVHGFILNLGALLQQNWTFAHFRNENVQCRDNVDYFNFFNAK